MTFPVTFLSFLLPVVAGALWVPSFLPGGNGTVADRGFRISLGAGVGLGAGSLAYFFLRSASAGVSAARLFLFEAVLFSSLAYLAMRYAEEKSLEASPEPDAKAITVPRWVPGTLAALFLFLVAGVILTEVFLTFDRPHGGWDAWAIWNLRARFLFRGRGVLAGRVFSPSVRDPSRLPAPASRALSREAGPTSGGTRFPSLPRSRCSTPFPPSGCSPLPLPFCGDRSRESWPASFLRARRSSSAWSLPVCRRAVRVLHAGDVLPAASVEVLRRAGERCRSRASPRGSRAGRRTRA